MSENFLTDNHCRNVKRLVSMGFEFGNPSVFMMDGEMVKRNRTFSITLLPLDGIALLNEPTADIGSPDFFTDNCFTWDELLDALLRRKAIGERTAARYREAKNDKR